MTYQEDDKLLDLRAAFDKAHIENDTEELQRLYGLERNAVRDLPLPERYDYFLMVAADLWQRSPVVIDRKIRKDANSEDTGVKSGHLELAITLSRAFAPQIEELRIAARAINDMNTRVEAGLAETDAKLARIKTRRQIDLLDNLDVPTTKMQ